MLATFLGGSAVLLTSAGWFPQVSKAVRSGSADDISVGWIGLFGSGILCWLLYGVLKADPAIIVANLIAIGAVAVLAVVRLRSPAPELAED